MVLKLTGSLLVTCSCGALGMWKAGQWKEHLRMLEQLRKMIVMLKGEILYAHAPLGEAFGHVGKKSEGLLAELFVDVAGRIELQQGELFYTIWQGEIQKKKRHASVREGNPGAHGIWRAFGVFGFGNAGTYSSPLSGAVRA